MRKNSKLDRVAIESPCSEAWENMEGNDRRRFCHNCEKDVFNLSEMKRRDAEVLLRKTGGRICVRFARLPNGRVLTTDMITGSSRRRTGALAAGLIAATLTVSSNAYSQGEPVRHKRTDKTVTQISKDTDNSGAIAEIPASFSDTSQIRFFVFDDTGSPISGAKVRLTGIETKIEFTAVSGTDGNAGFSLVPKGRYDLVAEQDGFRSARQKIILSVDIEPDFDVVLSAGFVTGLLIDNEHEIPLFQAVAENDIETVSSALNNGFDVNTKDSEGVNALNIAVEELKPEMVRLLFEYSIEILKGSEDTDTPIVILARNFGDEEEETIEILKMLIQKGADIDAVDSDKETALMYASRYDDLVALEILLMGGADTSLKNDGGRTAFDLASEKETVDLFHRYGIYF